MVNHFRSPNTAAALDEAIACACELGNVVIAERLFAIYRLLLEDYRSHKSSRLVGRA